MKFFSVLLTTLFLFPCLPYAKTIMVCEDCMQSSISLAIQAAAPYDTILISRGLFRERKMLIDKPLSLIGDRFPVIDAEGKGEILVVAAKDVLIEGIEFRNVGTSYIEDWAAIRVRRTSGFIIRNNRVFNAFFGIYLENSSSGLIEGNEIEGQAVEEMSSGNGIHLWYCKDVKVEDNLVKGHRDGIYLEFVDRSFVGCNLSKGNLRYGLHFMFSNDNVYMGNTFENNGAGVAVMFSRRIEMYENYFHKNWGKAAYGLLLKEIYDGVITNNRFEKNTTGIFVEGSNRIDYRNNHFVHNGWAIKMTGGCEDNQIRGNNFIANSFDLSIHAKLSSNRIHANYWSEYTGYDLDRDGIGDVPYRPVKLFNYIVNKTPESIILLRSMFIQLINYSEKVSPVFTPAEVTDQAPLMKIIDT